MKHAALILIVLAALICTGCPSPILTSRYAGAEYGTMSEGKDAIRVSAFVLDVPAAPAKGLLFELAPQAQSTLVRELAGKTESLDAFLAALNGGGDDGEDGDRLDRTRFRKRVVFSVEKMIVAAGISIGPADRVSEMEVTLNLPARARFLSWNRFETRYESVDLGKISAAQSSQAGFSGTLMPKGSLVPEGIPVSAEFARGMGEELLLKQRYVSLSGALAPQAARLYQQGVAGIDLAGNFFVDFDVRLADKETKYELVTAVGNLRSKGAWNPAEKVQVEIKTLRYPASPAPVVCDMGFDYILRRVTGKDDTIIEGDDLVRFLKGHGRSEFELLRATELRTRIFAVRALRLHDGRTSENGFRLQLSGSREAPLYFTGYSMARGFLDWLKETRSTRVGQFGLELDRRPLDTRDIAGLEIESGELGGGS